MTTAVCDSGPLTHLWQTDQWSAFGTFQAIDVATQVAQEVQQHVPLDQLPVSAGCLFQIHPVSTQQIESCQTALPPNLTLQQADLATLALAQELTPDLVLTDDLAFDKLSKVRDKLQWVASASYYGPTKPIYLTLKPWIKPLMVCLFIVPFI